MPIENDARISTTQATRLFALLGEQSRLRLLLHLAEERDQSVTALAEAVGMSQPTLSHQLQRLRLAGVVTCRREGRKIVYTLAPGLARDLLLRHVRP
jgi:DNA-binding transcriptional ArsR family regulator